LIALVHPAIRSSDEMSGLPVHFEPFWACAKAGAGRNASPNIVAESISVPASTLRPIGFTDCSSHRRLGQS
jgi:hypothetical protein